MWTNSCSLPFLNIWDSRFSTLNLHPILEISNVHGLSWIKSILIAILLILEDFFAMKRAKINSLTVDFHTGNDGITWVSHLEIRALYKSVSMRVKHQWQRDVVDKAKRFEFSCGSGMESKSLEIDMVPLELALSKTEDMLQWKGRTDLLDYLLRIGDHLNDIPDFNSREGHFHHSEPMVSMTRTQGGFQTIIMPSVGM